MDREGSPAYAALTPAGKRVLRVIECEVERGGGTAAISRTDFQRSGISHSAAGFGVKQVALLGFARIELPQRINVFRLIDDWQSFDADTAARQARMAKLPKPPTISKPPEPKPAKVKPVTVEQPVQQPRNVQRVTTVTLPRLSCLSDGR